MVIDPFPLAIYIPLPAVRVALDNVFSLVLPISNWPSVYVVWFVPPLATGTVDNDITFVVLLTEIGDVPLYSVAIVPVFAGKFNVNYLFDYFGLFN